MIENATATFSKKEMIQVASSAWLKATIERDKNIIHGFDNRNMVSIFYQFATKTVPV